MMKTAKLLLHCPDKPGILAEVTGFVTKYKENIVYLHQYVGHVEYYLYKGKNLEKIVLSRAVQKYIDRKVLAYKNKTVIFS